ncbi:MAG: PhzF family phenazine biosynthesis protein [Clostridia bacterium]|nr:PhzF family phenazine biosynthesis protein [Clostridia bacterium]
MKFYIADAFTKEVFGGNPAGVVILDQGADFPPDETMRKTAAELRYSETAFIRPLGEPDADGAYSAFNVRYFTPAAEVDLCGHATVASFYCLQQAGLVKAGTTVLNKTLAGDLDIVISEDSILMDMAAPEYRGTIEGEDALHELYEVLGITYEDNIPVLEEQCLAYGGDGSGLKPEIISTGLPDIMLPVATHDELNKMAPDFPALTELTRRLDVVSVHAFTLDGGAHRGGSANSGRDDVTAYCRDFAPLYDIDEEAATGTANGSLTYYLQRNEVIPSEAACLFIQGEAMDRPSEIRSVANGDAIKVGGSAAILAEGEIFL